MIQPLTKLRLLALAAKYRIEMLHHSDGHIIARINNWHLIEYKIDEIVEMFTADPHIHSIQIENRVIDITYDSVALTDEDVVQRWLGAIERFRL